MHNCCQNLKKQLISDPIIYSEESILWTCAAYSYKFDEELIKEKFVKFYNQKSQGQGNFQKKVDV